jgi:membrane-associated phospholipid phosphatase
MGMQEVRQAVVSQRSEVRSQRSELGRAQLRNDLLIFAAFATLLLFVLLTRAMLWQWQPLAEWDRACCERLHEHGRSWPVMVAAFQSFTFLAGTRMLFVEAVIVATFLAGRRNWRLALAWMTAICSGYFLVHILKAAISRPRPVFADPFELATNASFPSGHTSGAMLVFGLLAYLLARSWPQWKWRIYACCGVFILMMGFSRLYLGAHWLSDVLGGLIVALSWNLLAIAVMERWAWGNAATAVAPANIPAAAPSRLSAPV